MSISLEAAAMQSMALQKEALDVEQTKPGPEAKRRYKADKAATQFESLLLRELVKVLGKSMSPEGSQRRYFEMFEHQLAESIAKGTDLGLRKNVMQHMGVDDAKSARLTGTVHSFRPTAIQAYKQAQPSLASGAPLPGATGRMQSVAAYMTSEGVADRWAKDGSLTPADIGPRRGQYAFQGDYKCNLFAFEMARRAGFQVPLVSGKHYPASNRLTNDVTNHGKVRGDWGRRVTGTQAAALDQQLVHGQSAFLLTGSARPRGAQGIWLSSNASTKSTTTPMVASLESSLTAGKLGQRARCTYKDAPGMRPEEAAETFPETDFKTLKSLNLMRQP